MANIQDLRVNDEFDLIIEDGDIKISNEEETIKQEINNRLKTSNPDWFRHFIGADLEDLRGKKNKPETAELGLEKITRALTQDDFLKENDFEITYAPTAINEITYFIKIYLGYKEPITFPYVLELN